jgi:hypothetical protein
MAAESTAIFVGWWQGTRGPNTRLAVGSGSCQRFREAEPKRDSHVWLRNGKHVLLPMMFQSPYTAHP